MKYFLWEYSQEEDQPAIYGGWKDIGISFYTGNIITEDIPMLEIAIDENFQGELTDALCVIGGPPVFSDKLINLLSDNGIDNLQIFPCQLVNKVSGQKIENYSVVNILGKVSCIDFDNSDVEFLSSHDSKILCYSYINLDENKIGDFFLFILAEMPVQIVAHEKIVLAVEEQGITGIEFMSQGDVADSLPAI